MERRSLTILTLLLASTPLLAADRPVLPERLESGAPTPVGAALAPPACILGTATYPFYAITDWIYGAEDYATVFSASSGSCSCSGGFRVDQVHMYVNFKADDVPSTFNLQVGVFPTAPDAGVGCDVPAGLGCFSSVYQLNVAAAGLYDVAVPLDTDCGCFTFDKGYSVVARFPDLFGSTMRPDAVTDDIPVGCTSFNDFGAGWEDTTTGFGFPGEILLYADVNCCDGTICSLPGVAIPDFPAKGVSDSIVIPGPVTERLDVDLLLEATHTLVGDLTFTLEHVDTGTTVTPFDRPGVPADSDGCLGDDVDVRLNDEGTGGNVETTCLGATPTISGDLVGGDPPDTALFRPFEDEDPTGTWTLTVSDAVGGDTGTLDRWCLDLSSTLIFMDGFNAGDWCSWTMPVCPP